METQIFVLEINDDGDLFLTVYENKEKLIEEMKQEIGDMGYGVEDYLNKFMTSIPNGSTLYLENISGTIIIEGRLIHPKPIKVVESFEL